MRGFIDEIENVFGDMYELLDSMHVAKTLECSTEQEEVTPEPVKKLEGMAGKLRAMFHVIYEDSDYLRSKLARLYDEEICLP